MSREWKPGDVAMVQCSDGEWRQAAFLPGGIAEPQWVFANNARRWVGESEARPVVVIDAEDGEAVERHWRMAGQSLPSFRAALREYANPTPPKPDEPQGLGAVVEDEQGLRWSLLPPTVNGKRWACWDEPKLDRDYADIAAVRVLSEGVA